MKQCSIKNCEKIHWAKSYCRMHYARYLTHGNPNITLKGQNGSGCIAKDGYKALYIKGRQIREHRYVMEKHLGRRLKTDEHVHHIDHNKLNNSIENLQVISKAAHKKLHAATTFRNETHKQCTYCLKIKPRFLFWKKLSDGNPEGLKDANIARCIECIKILKNKRHQKEN